MESFGLMVISQVTVGKHGDEQMIGKYVQNQGKTYQKLYADYQLALF